MTFLKVLFSIYLFTETSAACISFPKLIKLSDSSFENEEFSLPQTERGIAFEHNQSSFFFNQITQQWCVFMDKSKRSTEAPVCLKDGQTFHLTDDREGPTKNKEIGLFQVSGKSIFLFSNSGKNKDTNKPYLKITDTTTHEEREKYNQPGIKEKLYRSSLTVQALSAQTGELGSYEISSKFDGPLSADGTISIPRTRGLGSQENVSDLNGQAIVTEAGCGAKFLRQEKFTPGKSAPASHRSAK